MLATLVSAWAAWHATSGIGWLDAGDFAAAAVALGVPHPPGFPLWTALSHGATALPLAEVGWRSAWLSPLCAGATVWLVGWIGGRWLGRTGRLAASLAAVAATVTIPTLRLHALVPEVYALNLLAAVAGLAAVVELVRSRDLRWATALSLVVGAGLANHGAFRVTGPLLVAAALVGLPPSLRVRALPALALPAVVLQLAWLYLPIVSARGPLHNWGDPSSWDRFIEHASGASILRTFAGERPGSLAAWWPRAAELLHGASAGWPLAVPAAALALAALTNWSWRAAALVGALLGLDLVFGSWLNPMGLVDAQNGQTLALGLAVLPALGLVAAFRALSGRVRPRWAGALVGALAIALLATRLAAPPGDDWAAVPGDDTLERIVVAQATTAAPESLFVAGSDSLSGAWLHARVALHARPDACWLVRNDLSDRVSGTQALDRCPWDALPHDERARIAAHGPGASAETFARRMEALVRHNVPHREIRWELLGPSSDVPAGYTVVHAPGVPRLIAGTSSPPCPGALAGWRCLDGPGGTDAEPDDHLRLSPLRRRMIVARAAWIGGWYYRNRQPGEAARYFALAIGLEPGTTALRLNLARSLAAAGDRDGGAAQLRAALEHAGPTPAVVEAARQFLRSAGDFPGRAALEADLRSVDAAP